MIGLPHGGHTRMEEVTVSVQGLLRSHSQSAGATDRRPTVVPTRRRLDRRFPSLGFTISSAAPWVEIVVSTDPALINPAKAADRNAENFYASRTSGGLTPTAAGRARYVLPGSVLDRLTAAAGALWYAAVAYADASGSSGVPSSDTGASGMVVVDPSVHARRGRSGPAGRGLSLARTGVRTLGVAVNDRLEGEDGADLDPTPLTTRSQGRAPARNVDDRLAGEDGADLANVAPAPPPSPIPSAQPQPPDGPPDATSEPTAATPAPEALPRDSALAAALDYDDGWDTLGLGEIPAPGGLDLDDEYPDIDWDGAGVSYGAPPGYLSLEEMSAGGDPGVPVPPRAPAEPSAGLASLPQFALPPEVQRRIIELTLGSDDAAYATVNADGAFRGRHGPGHKAYQRYHTGLSFGIAEFNQDSGSLGQLLRLMVEREPETFSAVFGEAVDELLTTVTAPGPSGEHVESGRGPRVQPVAGTDLWEEPWVSRFKAAGAVPAFKAAQNQLTAELFLAPLLPVAAGFGLTTERALCLVLDRAIVLGEQGAKRWIADTVGPMRTPALRHDALAALGFDTVESFQASVAGLLVDGEFGPLTHSALTAALRLSGTSPVPLTDISTAVTLMAQRAGTEGGSARFLRLATSADLSDAVIGG